MMKIIMISPCDLPIPAVKGGAVATLIDSIINQNEHSNHFEITVTSSLDTKAYKLSSTYLHTKCIYLKPKKIITWLDSALNVLLGKIVLSRKNRKTDLFWKLSVIEKNRKLLKVNSYDAVILENSGYLTRIFKSETLLKKYEGKIYYHLHNDIPDNVFSKLIRNTKWLLISKYLSQKIILKYGNDIKNKLLVLNNGIPMEKYCNRISENERMELRRKLGFEKSDKIVCYVGRIHPSKGVLELLQAIQEVREQKIKLLIIGATEFGNHATSDFERKVRDICYDLGDRVKATGYIPHEDVWKYYQVADIAALPSVWQEPAGLTILEAMASRLPVITTDAGGIPEFMKEDYGIMLKRGEKLPHRIAKAIEEMCSNLEEWKNKALEAPQYVNQNYSELNYFQRFCFLLEQDFYRPKNG